MTGHDPIGRSKSIWLHREPVAEDWKDRAACRSGVDPQIFFPDDTKGRTPGHREDLARRICHGCPVRQQCLEYSLAVGAMDGIWGGLTASERRELADRPSASSILEETRCA